MNALTIVVGGRLAAAPGQGGAAWAVLQYLLGFRRLGYDVWFVEELPSAAVRPAGSDLTASDNAAYFAQTMLDFGFADRSALLPSGAPEPGAGPHLPDAIRRADVLVNLSGALRISEELAGIPTRVYVDLDPGFTQVWHEQGLGVGLEGHTHFVTVGLSVGQADCPVPTCGRSWLTTVQPIVLEYWPAGGDVGLDAFTSVANWRGYGSPTHNGLFYGQKAHSLRPLMSLPRRSSERFVLALAIHPDERSDRAALDANGWTLVPPQEVAQSPTAYQAFIRMSKAELGIAKSGYVAARTGWFSDRSICYLASGRPVVAQDTGFSRHLPAGDGLLAFEALDDALTSIDAVSRRYEAHARAARSIAEQCFDSDVVLPRLLQAVGMA